MLPIRQTASLFASCMMLLLSVVSAVGCAAPPSPVTGPDTSVERLPIDWVGSPFAGASETLTPDQHEALTLPYPAIDRNALPAGVTIYRMGNQIAFVSSDPPLRVTQSPIDTPGVAGLDASDPAYREAEESGTHLWNTTLSDGSLALVAAGTSSATLTFERAGSLVEIGAPPDSLDLVIATAERIVSAGSP